MVSLFPSRLLAALTLCFLLAACAEEATHRAQIAAIAKMTMLGMPREQVLACMGPPKKKAKEGSTEVWSYLSTDSRSESDTDAVTWLKGYTTYSTGRAHHYCIVNVVIKDGTVQVVNYNGPSTTGRASNEQCAYAVANCTGSTIDMDE